MWGAYVGEVIRRHYGGRWAISKPEGVLQIVPAGFVTSAQEKFPK